MLKCILLIYAENKIKTPDDNSSLELVNSFYSMIKEFKDNVMGGDTELLHQLKDIITEIVETPELYTDEYLITKLNALLYDKKSLIKMLDSALGYINDKDKSVNYILGLRQAIVYFYRDFKLRNLMLSGAAKLLNGDLGKLTLKDYAKQYVMEIENQLTSLVAKDNYDPAIMTELDIDNELTTSDIVNKAKTIAVGEKIWKTGWAKLNTALQGGLRPGFGMINALQHNYKSSFLLSLFLQIPRYNTPIVREDGKKPLLLFISFEDNPASFLVFAYTYLYYNEFKVMPDIATTKDADISKYIKDTLQKNGFSIKMLRVNPSLWTYKDLTNLVLKYNANGFNVQGLFVDYFSELPVTGISIDAPGDSPHRKMFQIVRNFCAGLDILFLTPHQLDTAAKQLIKNGVSSLQFVNEVAEKGYTAYSKQLDQVIDLDIYLHRAIKNGKWVLTVRRGKHKLPTVIDEEDKFFILEFEKGVPVILEDMNKTDNSENKKDMVDDFVF